MNRNITKREIAKVDKQKINMFVNKFSVGKRFYLIIPFLLISIILIIAPIIVIIINVLQPVNSNINDNWQIMTTTIWQKIGKSLWIAVVSTIIVLIISFPFAYGLSIFKNKIFQNLVIFFITTPVWINILIKLIGLKSIFDIINGQINSTYGDIYTILGLIYIYTPFMIMPIFSALQTLPKNLINASKDLGRNNFYTFINITIPWCKTAIISGITLVLLPCFTTVIVSGFMNNNNDGSLIGSVIMNQGDSGLNSKIALARTSVLVLVVSCVTLFVYLTLVYIPKLYFFIKHKMVKKNEK